MALDTLIGGANLDAGGNIKTALSQNPVYAGVVRMFSENDPGDVTGTPALSGPIAGTSAWRAGAWRVGAWRVGAWREQLVPAELPVPPFVVYAGKRETASARRSKRVRDCTR